MKIPGASGRGHRIQVDVSSASCIFGSGSGLGPGAQGHSSVVLKRGLNCEAVTQSFRPQKSTFDRDGFKFPCNCSESVCNFSESVFAAASAAGASDS